MVSGRFPPSSLRLPSELTLLPILETVQDPLPEEIPDPTGDIMPEWEKTCGNPSYSKHGYHHFELNTPGVLYLEKYLHNVAVRFSFWNFFAASGECGRLGGVTLSLWATRPRLSISLTVKHYILWPVAEVVHLFPNIRTKSWSTNFAMKMLIFGKKWATIH